MEAVVRLDEIAVTYQSPKGETAALAGIDLHVRAGEFVAIVGPSGCGKSTILSLIARLFEPTAGAVQVCARHTGYMLQQDFLLPWRTVRENALLGLELQGRRDPGGEQRVDDLLAAYGLGAFLHHYPRELSGGMRQRVALVRTLAVDPDLFLLDEPFSALDYQTRATAQEDVWQALRSRRSTAILVTHDVGEAVAMSDRVIVLSGRPAQVKKEVLIEEGGLQLSPWEARRAPWFQGYVDIIWNELQKYIVINR